MLRACLVVAAARASQLNVQEAAVIVRGRAVSILSSEGCFTIAGTPCKVLRNGGDDDHRAHADEVSNPRALYRKSMASAIAYTADEPMAEAPTHGPAGPSPAAHVAPVAQQTGELPRERVVV